MSENLKRHRPDIKVLGEGKAIAFMLEDPMGVWCHIQEVRDLLDVKDKKIAELKEQYKDMDVTHTVHIAKMNARIEELEQKLQDQCMSCPVKMQEDDVVAEKDNEIRRLKRALYKACANWAHHRVFVRFKTNEKAWEKVERKCRAKMEEYK